MERYLVIAPQGLGDSLEATPFVQALRDARPDAKVHVAVTRPASRELFAGLPQLVDRILYLPYWERGALAFAASLLVQAASRRIRYDASFLMYPAARREYHVLARIFDARCRFSHQYWERAWCSLQNLQTDLVRIEAKHNVLRNLDLLTAAGIAHGVPKSYAVPQSWKVQPSQENPQRVVMHVGTIAHSGLEYRRWPVTHFAQVAEWLVRQGYEVVALMGPDEVEETRLLQMLVPRVRIVRKSLEGTAQLLSASRLAITNDSGIGHLAAGVGTDVIALFGPTPLEHAPFGLNATALRPSPCPPCFDVRLLNTGCALGLNYACLNRDLTPAYVIERVAAKLAPHQYVGR